MQQLVLTLIGKDKPGLVEAFSDCLKSQHANWLASNLSHLAGYFAGIVQIEVSPEHQTALEQRLAGYPGLAISVHRVESKTTILPSIQLRFVITGNDRPGIVHELSTVIRQSGANIIEFKSSRQSAPNWGLPIFAAEATVSLACEAASQQLVAALEGLASDIIIDVESA